MSWPHLPGISSVTPETTFILPDVMLDNTEEFIERDSPGGVSTLPPAVAAEHTHDVPHELPPQLAALTRLLQDLPEALSISDAIVGDSFRAASYRFSLLAFLGDPSVDPELTPLAACR